MGINSRILSCFVFSVYFFVSGLKLFIVILFMPISTRSSLSLKIRARVCSHASVNGTRSYSWA